MFTTTYDEILNLIHKIDPVKYGKTRNYADGAVTKLSPYISRGVISTRQVAQSVLKRGYSPEEIEVFIKELAWRDYFQQVWIAKGNLIDHDLRQPQAKQSNKAIPESVAGHQTGITAIDHAIKSLYENGYMHNHLRMYVASICCNIAQSHWFMPAQWMYYYLLDADWASNALSWQWVAGSFSSKKYYANQENINKYCHTNQQHTFLDVSYGEIDSIDIPQALSKITRINLETTLPTAGPVSIDKEIPLCIYNFYNLDCQWLAEIRANRILLLEPGFFRKYPVSNHTIQFILELSKNIKDVQIFIGEFDELVAGIHDQHIHYKEHPTVKHYRGVRHSRAWMFGEVTGYYPSFFAFWKQCEKRLKSLQE